MKRNMPRPPEIMRKGSAHGNKRRMTGRETIDMDDIWDDSEYDLEYDDTLLCRFISDLADLYHESDEYCECGAHTKATPCLFPDSRE